MRRYLTYFSIVIITAIIIGSCSDLQTNIPQKPTDLNIHKEGITTLNSPNFHGDLVKGNNWSFALCQQCHASDLKGGITDKSCFTCHTQTDGPKSCNTCHGNFNNPDRIAPPRDTNGDILTTSKGVGAHFSHLYDNDLTENVKCENCHSVPQNFDSPGHVDSKLPAELNFTGLAVQGIASNANYNNSTTSCSNTYCHGNFEIKKSEALPEHQYIFTSDKIVGLNKTVNWTKVDETQAECGSCHDIPPEGHLGFGILPLSSCAICHQGVVNDLGKIIDKKKHINGVADVGF